MAVRGTRLEKSVYTFGPVGRILWTLGGLAVLFLLLAPIVRILRGGLINAGLGALVPLFLAVAGAILLIWIFPRYIRDVWQPASVAGDELTELRDQMRREAELQNRIPPESDGANISQRTAPPRW
ncbi:MAG TPA: hypothetical protein VFT62_03930 [Mycobacteriales bacterium]|nr:hypothetical protein [Mycobacteriales bacterium]